MKTRTTTVAQQRKTSEVFTPRMNPQCVYIIITIIIRWLFANKRFKRSYYFTREGPVSIETAVTRSVKAQ